MKKIISVCCIFFGALLAHLPAQALPVDLFQSAEPIIPEYYGNGVIKHIVEADNLMRRGRFEEALISYDNAMVLDPYFAEGYIKRAIAKFRLGRTSEAKRDFSQGSRINPYAADLYGYRGSFSRMQVLAFDQEKLLSDIELEETNDYPTLSANSDNELLIKQVSELKIGGSVTSALQTVNRAIELSPVKDPILYKLRGNLYVLLDDFQRAIQDYNYTLMLDDSYEEAYFNRGIANLLANNRPDACSDMKRSIELGYEEGTDKMRYFCGL